MRIVSYYPFANMLVGRVLIVPMICVLRRLRSIVVARFPPDEFSRFSTVLLVWPNDLFLLQRLRNLVVEYCNNTR